MSKYRIDKPARYSRMFAALANPKRTIIFSRLASRCRGTAAACDPDDMRACVGELGKDLHIANSTISHHIKTLKRAGLIKMEKCGRTVKCRISLKDIQDLKRFLARITSDELPVPTRKRKRV